MISKSGPSEEFREVSRMATDVVVCARSAAPAGAYDRHIRSGKWPRTCNRQLDATRQQSSYRRSLRALPRWT